jgi:hypothetical protein
MVEVLIAGGVFCVLMTTVGSALLLDTQTQRVLLAQMGPEARARTAIERVVSDLRTAGVWGEDLNRNGVFDAGEDLNGDGQFDADWSLEDGGAVQAALSFNRRVDEVDDEGKTQASGIYSSRVTYRLIDDRLVREWVYVDAGGKRRIRQAELAAGVVGLRFSRVDRLVTVGLDVRLPKGTYQSDHRTLESSVWLTN